MHVDAGLTGPHSGQMHPVLRGQSAHTDYELRREVERQNLIRVAHGAYYPAAAANLPVDERHRLLARAVAPRIAPDAVFSHVTAAILHDLPVWGVSRRRVHVTRPHGSGRITAQVQYHQGSTDGIVDINGLPVTSLSRTLLDVACAQGFESAIVTGDAALRRGAVLVDVPSRRGATQARVSMAFMDGRSESVGESRSRVLFDLNGIPRPDLQRDLGAGEFLGRPDFYWEDAKLLGEFDGEIKYSGQFGEPGAVRELQDKREAGFRDAGFDMIRWKWTDLSAPDPLLARLRARLC